MSHIVDAVYTHDGCYLGIMKETNNHINYKLSKPLYIYKS